MAYSRRYQERGFDIPALVPQVYLHYDPYTAHRGGRAGSPLPRQRMDFLLLFSGRRRVVLEVDGSQHYSTNGYADPRVYGEMVREDRRLRLDGYEVYRFSSTELNGRDSSKRMLEEFFDDLERDR
jgi:very-short-patch-repair endonuclease